MANNDVFYGLTLSPCHLSINTALYKLGLENSLIALVNKFLVMRLKNKFYIKHYCNFRQHN
jgi:hypothetical protein